MNTAGKEDAVKDTIDKLSAEITAAGCKVETVQKMDKRNFARVTDKRRPAGFYVNVIFEGQPTSVATLRHKFSLNEDVYRVLFTDAPAQPEIKVPAVK